MGKGDSWGQNPRDGLSVRGEERLGCGRRGGKAGALEKHQVRNGITKSTFPPKWAWLPRIPACSLRTGAALALLWALLQSPHSPHLPLRGSQHHLHPICSPYLLSGLRLLVLSPNQKLREG